ncbi:hypothetical protein Trydic_g18097 [Trypoxylus dichotomus]
MLTVEACGKNKLEGSSSTEPKCLRKRWLKRIESSTTYRDWFRRFKDGDLDVDDRPREGRPKTFEYAKLEALLDEDLYLTQEEHHQHEELRAKLFSSDCMRWE